jgi:sugar/nucleoside kinase (ribokinase family)
VNEFVDIIVSGHLCVDLIPEMSSISLDLLPSPGKLFESGPLTISTGGSVSNTGLSLYRLGVNVGMMATVGDDLLGKIIIAYLEGRDPNLSNLIRYKNGFTGSYTIALSPARVDRIFLHHPGTNSDFGVDDVDFSLVGQAKIFHLGYPPLLPRLVRGDGEELAAIYAQAKATGVVTSLDMALPDPKSEQGKADWPKILRQTLPNVDVFMPSIEEIIFCLRRADHEAWRGNVLAHITAEYLQDLADQILDMGVVVAGFKLGEMGMYLQTAGAARFDRLSRLPVNPVEWANQTLYHPAFHAEVVGTTGAGDSAFAAFLASMLKGLSAADALEWACAVGACNVEAADSNSGIRSWEETQARLDAGWPVRAEYLPGYELERKP